MNLIREIPALQIIQCKNCGAKRQLSWREWTDPERKLAQLESFKDQHAACQAAHDRLLKIQFFSRPPATARPNAAR